MTTLRRFVKTLMVRSNALRAGSSILAIALALAFAPQARAQAGNPSSIVNAATLAALDNNGWNQPGTPILTRQWGGIDFNVTPRQQQWQLFPETQQGLTSLVKISSMFSFKLLDVATRCPNMAPAIQANQIFSGTFAGCGGVNQTDAFRFQRWILTRVGNIFFTFKNAGTGLCLTDLGNPGSGGGVFQMACDPTDARQRWYIWDFIMGKII